MRSIITTIKNSIRLTILVYEMLKKSISFSILLFLCLSAFGTRTSVAQDDLRIYFIGNSLSNDLIRSGGFEEIASSIVGESNVLSSQHIQCSTPLTGIIASAIDEPNTNHTCTGSASTAGANFNLGTYPSSLSNPIDVLVLQPFQNATVQEEIDSTKTIIDQFRANPNNTNSPVYIYQSWDLQRSTESYLDDWFNRTATLDEEFRPSKATYDLYFSQLQQDGYDFEVIPVGQAFANVSEVLQDVPLGNVTNTSELFRDFIHGSNAGRYLGALVAAHVITGESILNVADADQFAAFTDSNHALSADATASAALRQIAFDTVQTTSVNEIIFGDINGDGNVDFSDISPFLSLLAAGGFQEEADINQSGMVDFSDLSPFISILSNP